MHRRQILDEIRNARAAHLQWRAEAQAVLAGMHTGQTLPDLDAAQCRFGQWYASARPELGALPAFRAIEQPHSALHETCRHICRLQRSDDSPLSRYLGLSLRRKGDRDAETRRALAQLSATSDALLRALDNLEREVKAITEIELIALEPG